MNKLERRAFLGALLALPAAAAVPWVALLTERDDPVEPDMEYYLADYDEFVLVGREAYDAAFGQSRIETAVWPDADI